MIYLDTSALVRAVRLKLAPEGVTRPHSVAEFYATLTSGITVNIAGVNQRVRFKPADVERYARETFSNVTFRDFSGAQALAKLEYAAWNNVQGANIHDFMHAAVAAQEGCSEIVTANIKHFKLVTKKRLVEPTDYFGRA
ncbi:MAG: hypothetical protein RLZZ350_1338 [Verrucomicrobiota bacterium]|jgi:predicted nucleic acid-binding protein